LDNLSLTFQPLQLHPIKHSRFFNHPAQYYIIQIIRRNILGVENHALNCHYLPSSGPFLAPIQNPEIATNRFNKVALKSLKDINSVNISKRYLVILSNSIVHKSNKGGEDIMNLRLINSFIFLLLVCPLTASAECQARGTAAFELISKWRSMGTTDD